MSERRWSVRLHADPLGSLFSWFVLAGLSELAEQGSIVLRFGGERVPPGRGPWLHVFDNATRRECTVCIDTADKAALGSPSRSAAAFVTFKRSYDEESVGQLAADLRSRIRPLGFINHNCRSEHERHAIQHWLRVVQSCAVSDLRTSWKRLAASSLIQLRLATERLGGKGLNLPLPLREIEAAPERGSSTVLFQVGAWDPRLGSAPADREKVNRERAAVIRALRQAFGRRFVGGFNPSIYAQTAYPDCLNTETSTMRRDYWALIRQSDICISTSGLHRSNPSKIAEYLAASRPIVSQPLQFDVPKRLIEGVNICTFKTPHECVAICEELLDNPDRLAAMRQANHEYYWSEARPDVLMANRLRDLASIV